MLYVLLYVMYDEMSNKRRNTEGVVSIMTNPCLRHFVLCAHLLWCAPAQIGHAAMNIYYLQHNERERKMLWSCSKTAWLKRCSLSPATVAVLSLLAVGASTQTGTASMHSILLSLHVDRDMCFLDRAT